MKVVVLMKNMINKKNIIRLFTVLFLVLIVSSSFVYAELGGGLNTSILEEVTDEDYDTSQRILNPIKNVFATIYTIFQVIGLGGVVYMGVKYMYAGAEDKGQIKKTLVWMVVGVVFLFAAPSIITFIQGIALNTMNP